MHSEITSQSATLDGALDRADSQAARVHKANKRTQGLTR